jgi:SAM-dependent methyltransferase
MQFGPGPVASAEEIGEYERWRNRYARDAARCRSYERRRRPSPLKTLSGRADERMVCRALESLPEGARVLDVPCGTGRISRALGARGFQTFAADYSRFMLAESGGAAGSRCRADALRLPFRDGAFEAAVCFRFMQATPVELRIHGLRELGRVARRVVVNYPNVYSLRGLRRFLLGGPPLTNRLSEAQVQAEISSAGLSVVGYAYKARLFFEDFVVIAERRERARDAGSA